MGFFDRILGSKKELTIDQVIEKNGDREMLNKALRSTENEKGITAEHISKMIERGSDKTMKAALDNIGGRAAFNENHMDKLLSVSEPKEGEISKKEAKELNAKKAKMIGEVARHTNDFKDHAKKNEDRENFTLENSHVSAAITNHNMGAVKALYQGNPELFQTETTYQHNHNAGANEILQKNHFEEIAKIGTVEMVKHFRKIDKDNKVSPENSFFKENEVIAAIKKGNNEILNEFTNDKGMREHFGEGALYASIQEKDGAITQYIFDKNPEVVQAQHLDNALKSDFNKAVEKIAKKHPDYVTTGSFNTAIQHSNKDNFDVLRHSKGGEGKLTAENLTEAIKFHVDHGSNKGNLPVEENSKRMADSREIVGKIVEKHPDLANSSHLHSYIKASNIGGVELLTKKGEVNVDTGHLTTALENDVDIAVIKHLTHENPKAITSDVIERAIDKNNIEALDRCIDKNSKAITSDTIKHAIDKGNIEALDHLMDKKSEIVHNKQGVGEDIISHAIKSGDDKALSAVINHESGRVIKTDNKNKLTEGHLSEAINSSNPNSVKIIAEANPKLVTEHRLREAITQNNDIALESMVEIAPKAVNKEIFNAALTTQNYEALNILISNDKAMNQLSDKEKGEIIKNINKSIDNITTSLEKSEEKVDLNQIEKEGNGLLLASTKLLSRLSESQQANMMESISTSVGGLSEAFEKNDLALGKEYNSELSKIDHSQDVNANKEIDAETVQRTANRGSKQDLSSLLKANPDSAKKSVQSALDEQSYKTLKSLLNNQEVMKNISLDDKKSILQGISDAKTELLQGINDGKVGSTTSLASAVSNNNELLDKGAMLEEISQMVQNSDEKLRDYSPSIAPVQESEKSEKGKERESEHKEVYENISIDIGDGLRSPPNRDGGDGLVQQTFQSLGHNDQKVGQGNSFPPPPPPEMLKEAQDAFKGTGMKGGNEVSGSTLSPGDKETGMDLANNSFKGQGR